MNLLLHRRPDTPPEAEGMTLAEHLGELRTRVLVCAVAFVVTATAAFLLDPLAGRGDLDGTTAMVDELLAGTSAWLPRFDR